MHFGDPFAGPIPDLDWSLDWRFDQMVRKLETNDLVFSATKVAFHRFGVPNMDNLTSYQKRVLIDYCNTALTSEIFQKGDPA